MDKNIKRIEKYLTNINLPEYESEEHRNKLRLQVINRKGKINIMKNPIAKLSVAAGVLIAISLSLIPFNKSITSSAYAFTQTIEANNSIRTLHMVMSHNKGNEYQSVEIWARCDDEGKATNLCAEISDDISETDNQLRYFTWNDGILKIWWPFKNSLYVCRTNENEIERYWQQLIHEYNPRVLYQRLYDEANLNESIELNINKLSGEEDVINVQFKNFDDNTLKDLIIDSKTKYVKKYTQRDIDDEQDIFDIKIEYLAYNQPIDDAIFQLSKIPDNVAVYDRTDQLLGLEQGELTDSEIAKVLVQSLLEAAIAKDYKEISRLMENKLGDTFEELIVSSDAVEKFFGNNFNANLEQVVSIGEPKSYMSWPGILYVPCKVEIKDEKSPSRIVDIQITAKSIKYESGNRWIVNSLMKMGLILSGESVGEYQIGMRKDDVLKRLGKPKMLFYGDERYTFKNLPDAYFMAYNEISFFINDGLVEGITALGPSYKFPNGLSVGDTEESVIQAFGDDYRIQEFESKDFLDFEKEGLMFEVHKKNRTVLEINVTGNLISNDFEIDPKDYPLKGIIIPGQSVGEYQIGISKDDVLERMGKPNAIFYGGERYTLDNLPQNYFMAYRDISFSITDGIVTGITSLSPSFKFADGLGVGDTEESIMQAFGDDYRLQDMESKDFLFYEKEGLMFEIDKEDRIVLEINTFPIQ